MSDKMKDYLLDSYRKFFSEVCEIMNDENYSDDYRIFLIFSLLKDECEDSEVLA